MLLLQQKRKCYNVEAALDDTVSVDGADLQVSCHVTSSFWFFCLLIDSDVVFC